MKELLLKISLFIIITLALLFVLEIAYKKKAGNIYIDKTSYVINTKALTYDYVAGGSSRVHNNFNTHIFDSITKTNGFNIAFSGSALAENYVTLYLFLKNGNKTKNYLLQVEDNFLADPKKNFSYPFHDYLFMSQIGDPKVSEAFMNSVPILKFYIWKYIPFIKYAEFNNYYKLKYFILPSKTDAKMIDLKGYERLEKKHVDGFPKEKYEPIEKESEIDPVNIYYLNEIVSLCKENNIRIILYSSPIFSQAYNSYNSTRLHSALLNYCTSKKIPYFDFIEEDKYKADYFYDDTHLNSIGTDMFTAQLADSLKTKLTN